MKCEFCGKEFEAKEGPGRTPKYCSLKCYREADKEQKRIQYVGKREKVCAYCGKKLPKFKTRYCSRECQRRQYNISIGSLSHDEILTKVCPICNKEFTTWRSRQIYCSEECRSSQNAYRISKRYDGITVDNNITLKKLAKRDNNQCQICGLFVDWNDRYKSDKTIICGDMYPSIDHIQPISLGGLHSWDNVQLAHRICNSRKSNKVV